ncbi:ABC-type transport auxiliary lipoprotein family protein [Pseudomonas sp. UBA6310]|uniref:ABC-type transport auxiliary lipoprotein family protein n=1 Tax=Pseudomonas sp. UBA6310 TaxID=1947327 RepID=UPI00257CB2E7|nr:ABC-type transport auxiliary lipoprotein family protein [Pseudomonas sp. UBA6310]
MIRVFPGRSLALLAGALLLSGCSALSQPETVDTYLLPGGHFASAAAPAGADGSLRVTRPKAAGGLEGTRIAVLPQPDRLSFYKGARWSDAAPVLLRDRLIEALRAGGGIARLSSDDDNLRADRELGGNLRAFQSEYQAGQPQVLIRFDAQLIDTRSRAILASRRFEVSQPVQGRAVPEVVDAFGRASDELALQVGGWVLQAGE